MVYGIGSYTYQYNTRDTFGFALKSTFTVVNGEERKIYKDPKTDNGVKKSQTGMVLVTEQDGKLAYTDNLSAAEYEQRKAEDQLEVVFEDGKLVRDMTLAEVRKNVLSYL
ncbi:putative nicotinate phosphoribosyltransferase [compost metagenome]